MKIDEVDNRVYVTLSRRNLEELLSLLDVHPDRIVVLHKLLADGRIMTVIPEEDDKHYKEETNAGPNV